MPAPYLDTQRRQLSFGDIVALPWLFEAHLRADASSLRDEVSPAKVSKKVFEKEADVTFFVPVEEDHARLRQKPGTDYLLGHGANHAEAACLSDDCIIESNLGLRSGQEPTGRLLFAPVTDLREQDKGKLDRNWRRFQLGDDRVIEIHRSFQASGEDIARAIDQEVLIRRSVDDETREALELKWAAHACRRGPLVAVSNAEKLGEVLLAHKVSSQDQAEVVASVLSRTSAAAWGLEGRALERAGQEFDANREQLENADPNEPLEQVKEDLLTLKNEAEAALAEVEKLGS